MKITIITVTYNSAKTIQDTLQSVRSQNYENYEHLIIDGRSSDSTLDIINNFDNNKIKVYSDYDTGIYNAMNKGLKLATGDVVGFLNSDDFFHDQFSLEKIFQAFSNSKVQVCYGDLIYVSSADLSVVRYWKSKNYTDKLFESGWSPAHPTFYILREMLPSVGFFDEKFYLAADFDFMIRSLVNEGLNSFYIPSVLVSMRTGGATNSSLKGLLIQNFQIYLSFKKNKIKFNFIKFIFGKLITKVNQYLKFNTPI